MTVHCKIESVKLYFVLDTNIKNTFNLLNGYKKLPFLKSIYLNVFITMPFHS